MLVARGECERALDAVSRGSARNGFRRYAIHPAATASRSSASSSIAVMKTTGISVPACFRWRQRGA